ncbi:MAG: hypothetical protein J6Y19_10685, partial [Kiritimatiellae bacterium]|nr:hypothetical protein [Kiritimatiellia bacterium]
KTNGANGGDHSNYTESSRSYAGKGGDGNPGYAQGTSGGLYVLPSVGLDISPYRASDAPDASAFVNFLEVDVTLDLGLTDGSGKAVTTTYKQPFAYGMKALDDVEINGVNPRVKRAGYRFAGYWTDDGTCVYGPDYKPTMVMSPYTKAFTLHARWEVAPEILSVTSSGDAASTLGVYGNTAITLRDAVNALVADPLLVGTDGRRRVTFEKLAEGDTTVRLQQTLTVPAGVRTFEINGLYGLTNGVRLVAGPNASHILYEGKASDTNGMFSLASLTFEGLDFSAATHGGCVRIEGEASVSVEACSFLGNRKTGNHNGGAISVVSYQKGSELLVSSSTFAGNYCQNHGGAVFVHGAHALFVNTTFSGNTAGDLGGAILESGGGRVDLLNCTFAHDSARAGCSVYSANSNAVIRAVNCIFADEKKTWGAVAMSGGKLTTDWCSMDADPARVFVASGAAVTQVVAGVTHVVHPPLGGGTGSGNEDAAEIYHDPSYKNVRAVGRDGREVVYAGNRDAATIPFIHDQLSQVRTAPTRGAVRLAVGTEPVTVEIDGVLLDADGNPREGE